MLEKLGLDTSAEQPELLTRDTIAASDVAVTLGCGEECPYVPGVRYVDWPVADPGGQDEATVRRIIADLDARVRDLLVELVPDLELPRRSSTSTEKVPCDGVGENFLYCVKGGLRPPARLRAGASARPRRDQPTRTALEDDSLHSAGAPSP